MATNGDRGTYWNATADSPGFGALAGDLDVDIAIILGSKING